MPKRFTVNYEGEKCLNGILVKFLLNMKQKNNTGRGRQQTTGSETQHVWWKKGHWQRIMGAYGTGWEEQQESRLTGGADGLLPRSLSQQWGETQSWRVNIHRGDNYIFISVLDNPLISVQGRKWRGLGERRVEVLPWHFSLTPSLRHGCTVRALCSCFHGDVGQSADVLAQRRFGAGGWAANSSRMDGADGKKKKKLWLNLGHRDSSEQRQNGEVADAERKQEVMKVTHDQVIITSPL